MQKTLNRTETRYYIITSKGHYSKHTLMECREIMEKYRQRGITISLFEDSVWKFFSGVRWVSISFNLSKSRYLSHAGGKLGIAHDTMILMLKCFAISKLGESVLDNIGYVKNAPIKIFLQSYGESDIQYDKRGIMGIKDFLSFIDTPKKRIDEMTRILQSKRRKPQRRRNLQPFITYLVVGEEINRLFEQEPVIGDSEFIRLFPVYFWVNVSFVIPMRTTEICLTPLRCISRENGKVFISIRRTRLKKKDSPVHYDVEKDYEILRYPIPRRETVENIEKYIALTESHDRKYLFDFAENLCKNESFCDKALNKLLSSFISDYVNGNPRYSFVRKAAGIVGDFKAVHAGDSRHLALINLINSGTLPHICKEIAGHEHIDTTAGYYSNISDIIMKSAFFNRQKEINKQSIDIKCRHERNLSRLAENGSFCTSERHMKDNTDITDCIEEKSLHDCFGCRYYRPSPEEEKRHFSREMKKLDEVYASFIGSLERRGEKAESDIDCNKLFNELKTAISRFTVCSNMKAESEANKWVERQSIAKTC